MNEIEMKQYVKNPENWQIVTDGPYERTLELNLMGTSVMKTEVSADGMTWRKKMFYRWDPGQGRNVKIDSINDVAAYLAKASEEYERRRKKW